MAKDTYVDAITLVAEQVAQREKQTALPIDPFAIAKACEIDVLAREAGSGVSGFLLRVGDRVAIAYSTDIENDGFRRFSVSHELGHYFIDGHVDHLLAATGLHESRAGHVSRDRHEVEADRFAASLLMLT